MISGDVLLYAKSCIPLQNADFQSILPRKASGVTSSKKVQVTLIGNPQLSSEPKIDRARFNVPPKTLLVILA